jgi:hypothetical protein
VDVPMTVSYGATSPTPAQSGELAKASRRRERPLASRSSALSSADDSTELVEGSDDDGPSPKRMSVEQEEALLFRGASSPAAAS